MKNYNNTIIYKGMLFLFLSSLTFAGCKKDMNSNKQENQAPANVNSDLNTKSVIFKELSKQLIILGQDKEFKKFIYDECKVQKFGDYYVRIGDLLINANANKYFSPAASSTISKLVTDLKKLGARTPILFYPSVETKENNKRNRLDNARTTYGVQDLIVVEDNRELDGSGIPIGFLNDEYPGYVFNSSSGGLQYYQQINEEFAWENDVWVIGEEEICSDENMVQAVNDDGNPNGRIRNNGDAEYGGIIQVTHLNELESWILGKLEFRYRVWTATGTMIKNVGWGRWKRSNFKDNKWKDFGDFIAYWNTSNIGNWMIEGWIEEDGGSSSSTISYNFPAACTGCPTTAISFTKQSGDQDLGPIMVQFTDPTTTIYNISFANVKRRE